MPSYNPTEIFDEIPRDPFEPNVRIDRIGGSTTIFMGGVVIGCGVKRVEYVSDVTTKEQRLTVTYDPDKARFITVRKENEPDAATSGSQD